MLKQLERAEERFTEIEALLALPDTSARTEVYLALMKEYQALLPIVEAFRAYRLAQTEERSAEAIYADGTIEGELRSLAWEEMQEQRQKQKALLSQIELLLLPKDPNDEKDVIVEIRAGAGGEEAALFAADLYRMYSMFAARVGFTVEPLFCNETELGGYKEIDFQVSGHGAYSRLKFEFGVHRVQRVPRTESQGRIQTSTATVAVLPVAEAVDVSIDPADIVMETCKSSGAGGQHINKTESAVRIIHKPSGMVVECQEERSQHKNRDKAMKMLMARLYDQKQREQSDRIAAERKTQVGSGDRSERIRTYNFPQGRVTDHRVGVTVYHLDRFLDGEMDEILAALVQRETAELLRAKKEGTS